MRNEGDLRLSGFARRLRFQARALCRAPRAILAEPSEMWNEGALVAVGVYQAPSFPSCRRAPRAVLIASPCAAAELLAAEASQLGGANR
jgi:hypothetical protein